MEFRPCIDIHNGKVKQIVGSSLQDRGNHAIENFVSAKSAADYARLYKQHNIKGGHIILLNASDSEYYNATKEQALSALCAYPGGLQIGGGINADNACEYLQAGASHVIVTSFVFKNGKIHYDNLEKMKKTAGREHLVLDVSCRWNDGAYYIVTDRWQKFTQEKVNKETLDELSKYCDEFLIHAVDVEGKSQGIEFNLVECLGKWNQIPVTYAGGVHTYDDIELLKQLGGGKINVTIGSALDIFGGSLEFEKVIRKVKEI